MGSVLPQTAPHQPHFPLGKVKGYKAGHLQGPVLFYFCLFIYLLFFLIFLNFDDFILFIYFFNFILFLNFT